MSRIHPPLIRDPRVYLVLVAGLCALLLSGTVQTSQFVADKSVTHTTDPATPIGSGRALLDSQPFGALIGLPKGATLQRIVDLSTGHPAAPATASIARGESRDVNPRPPARPAYKGGSPGHTSATPAVVSNSDRGAPLLLASALSFSGNSGGGSFAPATNDNGANSTHGHPSISDGAGPAASPTGGAGSGGTPVAGSNGDGGTASGTDPANEDNQTDKNGAVADNTTKPDSEVAETQPEAPTTLARVAKESSVPEGGLKSLTDPETASDGAAIAPGGPIANRAADVPEPNNALLFAAGLIVLTMVSGFRRRHRG